MAALPMSCSSAASPVFRISSVVSPSWSAMRIDSSATASAWPSNPSPCSASTCTSAAAVCSLDVDRLALLAYIRWSATRRASARSPAWEGTQTTPYEQPMLQPSPAAVSASTASHTRRKPSALSALAMMQNSSPPMR